MNVRHISRITAVTFAVAAACASAYELADPMLLQTGGNPRVVARADLNGDGLPDYVVANGNTQDISVFMNDKRGVFTQQRIVTGLGPGRLNVVDVNNDGRPDLLVLNQGAQVLTLLENDGSGNLGLAGNISVSRSPDRVLTWRSQSGYTRVVVSSGAENSIMYLTFDETGARVGGKVVTVGRRPNAIINMDLDGDGTDELVVSNFDDGTVSVVGRESNRIGLPTEELAAYKVGNGPTVFSAAADLDGDGRPDLAVANQTSGSVSVLLNAGDKTFAAATSYDTGPGANSVAVSDINRDGKPDLIVSNGGGKTISVLLNKGDGMFENAVDYETGNGPGFAVVADIDGDGIADLTVANTSGSISYLAGKGDGSFVPLATVDLGTPITGRGSAQVADLDSDGNVDTVVALPSANHIAIVKNPNGGFVRFVEYQRTTDDGTLRYYITPSAWEKDALDAGIFRGWERTGLSFRGYAGAFSLPSDDDTFDVRQAVCQRYTHIVDMWGNLYPLDCGTSAQRYAALEGALSSSDTGYPIVASKLAMCSSNTQPVYRLVNEDASNHRYTVNASVRDSMVKDGWLLDGNTPDGAVMCAP